MVRKLAPASGAITVPAPPVPPVGSVLPIPTAEGLVFWRVVKASLTRLVLEPLTGEALQAFGAQVQADLQRGQLRQAVESLGLQVAVAGAYAYAGRGLDPTVAEAGTLADALALVASAPLPEARYWSRRWRERWLRSGQRLLALWRRTVPEAYGR